MNNPLYQFFVSTLGLPLLYSIKPQKRIILLHDTKNSSIRLLERILLSLEMSGNMTLDITFDDGFFSSYCAAMALTRKHSLFFVCPSFIESGKNNTWRAYIQRHFFRYMHMGREDIPEDMRPTSWSELLDLVRLGHSIGSHSMTHARLSRLSSKKELEREIIGSADRIEDILGIPVTHFAYPFGDYKSISVTALKIISRRFGRCYTAIRGNNERNESNLIVWRDGIELSWLPHYIEFILWGGLDWHYAHARKQVLSLEEALLNDNGS